MCIKLAFRKLMNNPNYVGINFQLDEATRGESGSPNIPQTILDKISRADMAVCDITTINPGGAESCDRKTPNPNVTFELGYAVARLGWERIAMVFNKGIGEFPGDVPFDFDRHRVCDYQNTPQDDASSKADAQGSVVSYLATSVEQILKTNPRRPTASDSLDTPEVRHQRDVRTLRYLLAHLPVPFLEVHARLLPDIVHDDIFGFWEGFNEIMVSVSTRFYDAELSKALSEFHDAWENTLNFGHAYHHVFGHQGYRFNWREGTNGINRDEVRAEWESIGHAATRFRSCLDNLVGLIHRDYIEVDLVETSKESMNAYVEQSEEFRRRFFSADDDDETST